MLVYFNPLVGSNHLFFPPPLSYMLFWITFVPSIWKIRQCLGWWWSDIRFPPLDSVFFEFAKYLKIISIEFFS